VPVTYVGGLVAQGLVHSVRIRPVPPVPLTWQLLELGWMLVFIGVPIAAFAVTTRVFMNELRWRREGDPRGK